MMNAGTQQDLNTQANSIRATHGGVFWNALMQYTKDDIAEACRLMRECYLGDYKDEADFAQYHGEDLSQDKFFYIRAIHELRVFTRDREGQCSARFTLNDQGDLKRLA